MPAPQEGGLPSETEDKRERDGQAGEKAASSPRRALSVSASTLGQKAAGDVLSPSEDSTARQVPSQSSPSIEAAEKADLPDNTAGGINSSTPKSIETAREASVPSTSMLPVHSGPPIHIYTTNRASLPVSSSSSSQSVQPPTASQLLKGKQKEGSIPLSPFGQNDTNNSRADKDDTHVASSALKAFVRPEAADTQIAATTSDSHVPSSSGLSSESSWPSINQTMSASLDNFSLPSEGLFPSDGSDMADLFGPGSAALFEQLRAAMRVSPEAPSWVPPAPEQQADKEVAAVVAEDVGADAEKKDGSDSDDSDEDDADLAFNFDLDAQINAAMASLTESAQATVASPAPAPAGLSASTEMQAAEVTHSATAEDPVDSTKEKRETTVQEPVEEPRAPTIPQDSAPQGTGPDSDSDEEDEDDNAAAAAQFDLDAMLASAMGQAAGAVAGEDVKMQEASAPTEASQEKLQQAPPAAESSDESEDDEQEPVFDLDAHLRQAMALAREQASLSPGEEVIDFGTPLGPPSSDESSDDEGGFDLDAHIGQALADQLLASVQQQAPRPEVQAPKPAAKEPSPDFMAHDLQNMLQAAMKQAALELEMEQQEQTLQLEGMTLAAKEQALAFPGQPAQPPPFVPRRFAVPPKPRTRPRVEDDGDPENAYNKSRQAHPQALHTFYKCDFKGCDKVFARLQAFQSHRQGHQGAKPYKCHLCPATFASNQEFQDHSWTHNRTREWKYRCKGCFNLFGDKGMFDQHVSKARDMRCSRGECELQMRPAGARVTMPPIQPMNGQLSKVNHENYFVTSSFDQSALLAATLVHQMSSLLARQYDRQTSLLGPNDPTIDVNLALRQTFQRAGLTPNETAALATILASVGHARNEGLKASLEEARKAQFEAYRKHQERQRKAALKQIKRERRRLKQEAEKAAAQQKRKADQAAQAEKKKKQAEAQKNGDIPVPQAQTVM